MATDIVVEDREKDPRAEMLNHASQTFYIVQTILRVVAVVSTAVALGILLTSKQQVLVFGIALKAQYSYSPAFK